MVNFIVLNESQYEIDNIDVTYVDDQSMDNQQASSDGVTVLSDTDIPNGTVVSEVSVKGVVITEEPTPISAGQGQILIASLMYFTNPKSGQTDVVGFEAEQQPEG